MTDFGVTWAIDVEADTPREAAEAAMEIMLNPSFDSAIFRVRDQDNLARPQVRVEVPYP